MLIAALGNADDFLSTNLLVGQLPRPSKRNWAVIQAAERQEARDSDGRHGVSGDDDSSLRAINAMPWMFASVVWRQ